MNKTDRARIAKALNAAADSLEEGAKVSGSNGGRIYVANLAAYNNGKLQGEWIEPDSDPGTLGDQIIEAIGGNADDEWAIHDYDDFPDLGEHPGIDEIAKVVELFDDHDETAVKAALSLEPDADAAESLLDNGYSTADSEEDYAYELIDSMGGVDELPKETIHSYIDVKKLARDLQHDVTFVESSGGTYAFYNH